MLLSSVHKTYVSELSSCSRYCYQSSGVTLDAPRVGISSGPGLCWAAHIMCVHSQILFVPIYITSKYSQGMRSSYPPTKCVCTPCLPRVTQISHLQMMCLELLSTRSLIHRFRIMFILSLVLVKVGYTFSWSCNLWLKTQVSVSWWRKDGTAVP